MREVRRPQARRGGGDARVDGVRAVVEEGVLALERGVADGVDDAIVLERLERVRRVFGDERLQRRAARWRGDAEVGLLARRVVLRRVGRGQVLSAPEKAVAGAVEHRQHGALDVVGVDLVAGQEELVRTLVGVERGRAAPLQDQVVDERERVEAALAVRLGVVAEAGPAAAAVEDLQIGERGGREREARQFVERVAERKMRQPAGGYR